MWMTDRHVKAALSFHWYPHGASFSGKYLVEGHGPQYSPTVPNPLHYKCFLTWVHPLVFVTLSHVLLPWDVVFLLMEVSWVMPGQLSCVSVFTDNWAGPGALPGEKGLLSYGVWGLGWGVSLFCASIGPWTPFLVGCRNWRVLRPQEVRGSCPDAWILILVRCQSWVEGAMCVQSVEKGEQNSGPKLPQAWEPAQEDFYRDCSRPRVFLWVFAHEAEGLLHAPAEWCLRLTDFVISCAPLYGFCERTSCSGQRTSGMVLFCLVCAWEKVFYGVILYSWVLTHQTQFHPPWPSLLEKRRGHGTKRSLRVSLNPCLLDLCDPQQSHPPTRLGASVSSFCKMGLITPPARYAGLWGGTTKIMIIKSSGNIKSPWEGRHHYRCFLRGCEQILLGNATERLQTSL